MKMNGIKFKELKGIIHFISNDKIICNVELEFDDIENNIPLLFEKFPYDISFFLWLSGILEDKKFVKKFLKEEFNISISEFNKLTDVEKALIIFTLLFDYYNGYWFNISSPNESEIFLKNTIGDSKIVKQIFNQSDEKKSHIIINILPEKINNVSRNFTFNIYINLNTMEVFLDELFMFAKGDLEDNQIFAYNMFSYHFDNINEVENMYNDSFIATLTKDEFDYFVDLLDGNECVVVNIDNEKALLRWIWADAVTNIISYNNSVIAFKLPSYLLYCNYTSKIGNEVIHNNDWFDSTKCPKVVIHLMDYFVSEKNIDDSQNMISKELNSSKQNSINDSENKVLASATDNKKTKTPEKKSEKNTGYTAKNVAILNAINARDCITALDLASNGYSNKHNEADAKEYSKKMRMTLLHDDAIWALDEHERLVMAVFNRKKGVQFFCYCNEHKTKTNPCIHIRALYYLSYESLSKTIDEPKLESKEISSGYTEKNQTILSAPDFVNDMDLAANDFLKNHSDDKAGISSSDSIETSVSNTGSTYKKSEFNFGKLDRLVSALELVSFVLFFVAIICSYCTTATLTMYLTYKGEIAGRAMYTKFNIGLHSGFFFALMYLTTAISLISKFFIANKEKEFISFVISSISSFIAGLTFTLCMNKYSYINDISYIPYYDEFKTIEESCIVSGPGGFATFLFISIAIVFAIIAFIKYKKEN